MQMPSITVIESWPAPNYIDPVVRGPANIIIIAIFLPLALLVVGIRFYTRICLSNSLGVDDWLILATLFPTTAFAILALLSELYFGWNRHIWDVELSTITIGLKVVIITEILFCLATSLTKLSMLTLTYRIVANSSSLLSQIIIGTIILVFTQGSAFIFLVLLQCQYPSVYWTPSFAPQPQCMSETKLMLAAGIVNTITDLFVVLLPIPVVWRVKLPVQQLIILVLLFAAGFFVTLVGAVRSYYLYNTNMRWDKTWEAFPVWITSSLELYVGIICASIPATKKFFGRYGKWLGSTPNSAPPTTHAQSNQLQEEHGIGTFALQEYVEDKRVLETRSLSRAESGSEDNVQDLESPQMGYLGIYAGDKSESRDDLVQRTHAERVEAPETPT